MCLDLFLVLNRMMDVLWCPTPPPTTLYSFLSSLKKGRGSSLSSHSDWMRVVDFSFFGGGDLSRAVYREVLFDVHRFLADSRIIVFTLCVC